MAKLTLSVDASVIDEAKRFTHGRGTSLSAMVEAYLKEVTSDRAKQTVTTPVLRAVKRILKRAEQSEYRTYLESKYR